MRFLKTLLLFLSGCIAALAILIVIGFLGQQFIPDESLQDDDMLPAYSAVSFENNPLKQFSAELLLLGEEGPKRHEDIEAILQRKNKEDFETLAAFFSQDPHQQALSRAAAGAPKNWRFDERTTLADEINGLPHLTKIFEQKLNWARWLSENRETDRAILQFNECLTIAHGMFHSDGGIVSLLAGTTLLSKIFGNENNELNLLYSSYRKRPDSLKELQASLAKIEEALETAIPEAFRREYSIFRSAAIATEKEQIEERGKRFSYLPNKTRNTMAATYRKAILALQPPLSSAPMIEKPTSEGKPDWKSLASSFFTGNAIGEAMLKTAAPDLGSFPESCSVLRANLQVLQCSCAANLYKEKFGNFPKNLSDLKTAGFLTKVPKSPFDGKELVLDHVIITSSGKAIDWPLRL